MVCEAAYLLTPQRRLGLAVGVLVILFLDLPFVAGQSSAAEAGHRLMPGLQGLCLAPSLYSLSYNITLSTQRVQVP